MYCLSHRRPSSSTVVSYPRCCCSRRRNHTYIHMCTLFQIYLMSLSTPHCCHEVALFPSLRQEDEPFDLRPGETVREAFWLLAATIFQSYDIDMICSVA